MSPVESNANSQILAAHNSEVIVRMEQVALKTNTNTIEKRNTMNKNSKNSKNSTTSAAPANVSPMTEAAQVSPFKRLCNKVASLASEFHKLSSEVGRIVKLAKAEGRSVREKATVSKGAINVTTTLVIADASEADQRTVKRFNDLVKAQAVQSLTFAEVLTGLQGAVESEGATSVEKSA